MLAAPMVEFCERILLALVAVEKRRHGRLNVRAGPLPSALVGEEEKRTIPPDGSANRCAPLEALVWHARQSRSDEWGLRLNATGTNQCERLAVEVIRSRLSGDY